MAKRATASRRSSGGTQRRSRTGRKRTTSRAPDAQAAPPESTRGQTGDRLSTSRRRSFDASRRSRMSGPAMAEDAELGGGPDRSVGLERQDDGIDDRDMREGSNPRAASEAGER